MQNFTAFRAEVKKRLALRDWKHKDLAKATGYSVDAINSLMCGSRCSDALAVSVARALEIPDYMIT